MNVAPTGVGQVAKRQHIGERRGLESEQERSSSLPHDLALRISTAITALIASSIRGQAAITLANSGSLATRAPYSAPGGARIGEFAEDLAVVRLPPLPM